MTPEQFVIWLSGYFTGGRDNDTDAIIEDILKALKTVNINVNTLYFGETRE